MIAIVNQTTQNDLIELMGEEDFQELLVEAAVQFKERVQALELAIEQADWGSVRTLAHKIKGSMGSLGYDALFQVLDSVERTLLEAPNHSPQVEELNQIKNIVLATTQALPSA